MTYQLKFQECPYKTSNGRCTHRYRKQKITRRKRFCGYSKPEQCKMYDEWKCIVDEEKSIPTPITTPQTNKGESM